MNRDSQREQMATPRDYDDPSFSEVIPIKSKKINLIRSPFFWFIIITGALTFFLFSNFFGFLQSRGSKEHFVTFGLLTIAYLLIIVLSAIYIYSRTDKPIWAFIFPVAVLYVLMTPPVFSLFSVVFRDHLPAGIAPSKGLVPHFIFMFSGAGLQEELIKSVPGIIGATLVLKFGHLREKLPSNLYDLLAVRGPLDGLLFGVVAGATFIFVETGFGYFPRQFAQEFSPQSALQGLMLLVPRVTGGMVGHMCWAGITGYFIGLYVVRPKTWKYVLYSWIGVSLLHASWNTSSYIEILGPLSIFIGGVFLAACLLKARQMEQAAGHGLETYGSIVVDPATAPGSTYSAPQSKPASDRVQPAKRAASAEAKPVFLRMGTIRLRAAPGQELDFSSLEATGIDVSGLRAEVTRHPIRKDVVGLKNIGDRTWSVTLRDGSVANMEKGRNIRLAPGVKISFNEVTMFDVEED